MTLIEIKKIGNYKIELESKENKFVISELEEGTNEYNKLQKRNFLEDAEKYIEDREKRLEKGEIKKKDPLLILYKKNMYGEYKYSEGKITSCVKGSYRSYSVWIVDSKKGRNKEGLYNDFIKNTEENKQKLQEIDKLEKQAENIRKSLEKISTEEIIEYFKEV